MNEYIFIRLWGNRAGSFAGYINQQIEKAKSDNAPATAIFQAGDGSWVTVGDMSNPDLANSMIVKALQLAAVRTS